MTVHAIPDSATSWKVAIVAYCEFKTEKLGRLYRRDLSVSIEILCLQINAMLPS